jgi:hypothetical protein
MPSTRSTAPGTQARALKGRHNPPAHIRREYRRIAVRLVDVPLEDSVRLAADQDGQELSVRPVSPAKSPLDIPGVDLHLSAQEIVQAVREGRERQQRSSA